MIQDRWWRLDDRGAVHAHDGPVDALIAGGVLFVVCELDSSRNVAVFLHQKVSIELREQLFAHRPEWMHGSVYIGLSSEPHDVEPRIDAELGFARDVALDELAFAASCATYSDGNFAVTPERYLVGFPGPRDFEVTIRRERPWWRGEVRERMS